MPLNDNMVIEKKFGEKGIFCIDDLSHEIFSVGSNFEDILLTLNTFELTCPVSKFETKYLGVHDDVEGAGGGYLQKDEIDMLLERIL